MMRYIHSQSTDPCRNLALEQYIFDCLDRSYDYFMLWQNENSVIVGKHQNTAAEIDTAYIKENGIKVVRRLSGGGAVYHDLGNLNFTFIADCSRSDFDFSTFCRPVMRALGTMGVKVDLSGRNDMSIEGRKFSGSAMYLKNGRVMHHGTLLYDSNLDVLSKALRVQKDKYESKGIGSVRSRVTNILPYLERDISIGQLIETLRNFMFQEYEMEEYALTEEDLIQVTKLHDDVYNTWDWNYGASPKYNVRRERRFENCGNIEVFMEVQRGVIHDIRFYGDFFGCGEPDEIASLLTGRRLTEEDLRHALKGVSVNDYFQGISLEDFLNMLL